MPVKARPLYSTANGESLNELQQEPVDKQRSLISGTAFNNKSTALLDIPEEGNEGTGHFNMAFQNSRDEISKSEKDQLITINSR